jgi:hypothetical protein
MVLFLWRFGLVLCLNYLLALKQTQARANYIKPLRMRSDQAGAMRSAQPQPPLLQTQAQPHKSHLCLEVSAVAMIDLGDYIMDSHIRF